MDNSWRFTLFLVALAFVTTVTFSIGHAAINYKYINLSKQDLGGEGAKINIIESPLSGAPSFVKPGQTLRIELDDGEDVNKPLTVWMKPSFGEARERIDLSVQSISNGSSNLWPNRDVQVVKVSVPSGIKTGLYDIHVKWKEWWGLVTKKDFQPRALEVTKSFPENPKVALIGDPQVGDPRALIGAAKSVFKDGDLAVFEQTWNEVIGDLSKGDRWAAFQKLIQEINAREPDFVLVSGDLTFGADYDYEFEDAYRLLNQIQAPTFIAPGNHDGYNHLTDDDGLEKWKKYFGPLHYTRSIGSQVHLVAINSFDWSSLSRTALRIATTVWGGSVRSEQLNWLDNTLSNIRSNSPNGLLMTFAHHDPSWEQSPTVLDSLLDLEMPQDQEWSGDNRLALRRTLNEHKVDVHFSGHVHHDGLSRFIDDGTTNGKIVEDLHGNCFRKATPQKGDLNDDYSIESCSNATSWRQSSYKSDIRDYSNGPLFMRTTTTSSSTGQYWGMRVAKINRHDGYYSWWSGYQRGGVDPAGLGHPISSSKIDQALADQTLTWLQGQNVNQDMKDVGYYSTPSYLLDVEKVADYSTYEAYKITNQLSVPVSGEIIQSLNTCSSISTNNGTTVWTREDKDAARTDIKIAYSVDPGQTIKVSSRSWQGESSCDDSSSWWW